MLAFVMPRASLNVLVVAFLGLTPLFATDYLAEVKPLLTRHCVSCHGADQSKGGLRLDSGARLLQGGDSGPAVIPRDPAKSPVILALHGTHDSIPRMPYKKTPLPTEDVAKLEAWIREGAAIPSEEVAGRYVHWAFVAPNRPQIPTSLRLDPGANPIDAFIRARLDREGIAPSPEADPVTLLRRAHLDLTGLPPSPSEIQSYLASADRRRYENRIEELLNSPHYGERWARWWLDVARYADSNGYSIDAPRSMWPWRDWVIQSFNEDKPFDTFIVEQLAGDLLPNAGLSQRIATGFHRNTQINQEGGIDPEQFRIESVIDRVNTTGSALLGLTLGCAQCHDHKFDPLTQRDYFQMFAFFNDQEEPTIPVPSPEHQLATEAHARKVREIETELAELQKDGAPDPESSGTSTPPNRRSELEGQLRQLQKSRPQPHTTLVLAERSQPRESYLFINGDFTRRGPDVTPGFPAVLNTAQPSKGRLNRLDLALWMVEPSHPLTARVVVNRVWQQYLGRGLVETENDFGSQGTLPSHPDLLDWLATEFVTQGWSLRALHRLIVTSATYRQSSRFRSDLRERDPDNRLLARQNRLRLDAEIIRDVALAASGTLDPRIGGPSVFPPQPDGVMNLGQSRREWKASEGGDRFRRGLYTFFWRATPHPALAVFDAPDAFSTCTRRLRSNTPLQALTLLNDAAFSQLAQALAQRVAREAPPDQRLSHAFQLCVARLPSPLELDRLSKLFSEESEESGELGESAAWQTVARVLLNLDETITRE